MTARRHAGASPAEPRQPAASPSAGFIGLAASALFVSANLCLFAPYQIVSSNRAEFDATWPELLPALLVITVALAAVITLAALVVPRRFRHLATSIVLAAGVLLWFQGNFLRWGYGEFKGVGIDWSAFPWQGWVDAAIWCAVVALAVRFSRWLSRNALFVAVAFLVAQSGFALARAASGPAEEVLATQDEEGPTRLPDELCQLSRNRNVFHIIMDSFQTDVFMELVQEEDLAEKLDGFVVYRGNISSGARTVLAVPAVFSTNVYSGTETESEYFRRAAGGSFHYLLYQKDYVLNLMPHVSMARMPGVNYFKRPATYALPDRQRMVQATTYALDVSLFRQLPHFLKRAVYNDRNWRLSALAGDPPTHVSFHQKAFFNDYISRLTVVHDRPAYHFVHLMPPHGPFVTLADGSYSGKALPNTRENYKNEARYILRLFMKFLDRLRELGLYDSSVVLLHGDHGAGFVKGATDDPAAGRISKVSALLLLKTPGAHGPLRSNYAQTSLTDIPATMMDLLGVEHPYPGESILEIEPSETRTRRVVFVTDQSAPEPLVHRWLVTGNAADTTSWHAMEPRRVHRRLQPYEWGTRLNFGIANRGDDYLTSGWSTTSPTYTWSSGHLAQVTFGIEPPSRDVAMKLTFFAYVVPGKVDRQRVRVSVNGVEVGEFVCPDRGMREVGVTVPRNALTSDRMVVTFDLPDAVAPKDIDEGGESRELGIGLYAFSADLVPGG